MRRSFRLEVIAILWTGLGVAAFVGLVLHISRFA